MYWKKHLRLHAEGSILMGTASDNSLDIKILTLGGLN